MHFNDIPKFPYGNYEVDISMGYLLEHVRSAQADKYTPLDLDPDFQRAHVWDEVRQVRFVEYILKGGRSNCTLYFNCPKWPHGLEGPYQIVDGKQRLQALLLFLDNKLKIFGGHYLKDICGGLRLHRGIRWHVNNLDTRAEVLRWYLDLNEGGVVHTDEELSKVKKLLAAEDA